MVRELGRGGMGVVYEVLHPSVPRPLALKLMLGEMADPDSLLRFQREGELLAQLRHPNVVVVHSFGASPAGPYLVTDRVDGQSLSDRLHYGPLPPEEAARVVRDLAGAVQQLHDKGCLHRDIKPENIIQRPDGTPVLIDFGLAREATDLQRLTQTGAIAGTPAFMSPEQADGAGAHALDGRTDVYGLGAVLFSLLTGRPPFAGQGVMSLVKQVLTEEPRWPKDVQVPSRLQDVCARAMAKRPAERFVSAAALGEALSGWLAGDTEEGAAARRRLKLLRLLAVAALLAVLAEVGRQAWVRRAETSDGAKEVEVAPTDGEGEGAAPFSLVPTWQGRPVLRKDRKRDFFLAGVEDDSACQVGFLSEDLVLTVTERSRQVRVWHWDRSTPVFEQTIAPQAEWGEVAARGLGISPDGARFFVGTSVNSYSWLFTRGEDGGYAGRELALKRGEASVAPVSVFASLFDPLSEEVLIGARTGNVVRVDVSEEGFGQVVGELVHEVDDLPRLAGPVGAMALSPDAQVLATASTFRPNEPGEDYLRRRPHVDLTVKLWRRSGEGWSDPETLSLPTPRMPYTAVAFHPSGALLAIGGRDFSLQLYDVAARRRLGFLDGAVDPGDKAGLTTAEVCAHPHPVVSVWFAEDEEHLVSVGCHQGGQETQVKESALGTVKLWSVSRMAEVKTLAALEDQRAQAFQLSPSGDRAILAMDRGRVRRYHVEWRD